jgi:ribosomal protein S12 methylthiotransferase accessory factor YcaO
MPRQECPLSTAPKEVLHRIFSYLRHYKLKSTWNRRGPNAIVFDHIVPRPRPTDPRETWLCRVSMKDLRDGRKYIVPMTRVCRLWNEVATEMLYTEIDAKGMCNFVGLTMSAGSR